MCNNIYFIHNFNSFTYFKFQFNSVTSIYSHLAQRLTATPNMKRLNNNSIDFSFSFATKYLNLCRMCSAQGNWKYLKGMYLIDLISLVKEIIGIYTQSMYTLFITCLHI